MIVGMWYVQTAAIWRWYFPLCSCVIVLFLLLFQSIPFFKYFSLILMDGMVSDTSMS